VSTTYYYSTCTNTQAIEMKRSLPTKTNKIPSDILSPQAWTVLLIIVLTDYNGMYCSSKWYSHVSDIMVTGLWLTVKLVECLVLVGRDLFISIACVFVLVPHLPWAIKFQMWLIKFQLRSPLFFTVLEKIFVKFQTSNVYL
jgi:hypothetical protein